KTFIGGYSALAHQHTQLRKRGNVAHGVVIANFTLTTEVNEIRQAVETFKIITAQTRRVPKEAQTKKPIESTQTFESFSSEWPIDKKIGWVNTEGHQSEFRFFCRRRLEAGKLLQQRETVVAYVPAGLEATQFGFSCEGGDRAITRVAAQ